MAVVGCTKNSIVTPVWLAEGVKGVDIRVARRAAGQYSVIHRQQAIALGMTARQIDARSAAGLYVPVHPGVYRLAAAPARPEQAIAAACLAGGPGAIASHRAAAWLWDLRGVNHATTERRGIPVTTPAHRTDRGAGVLRTLLDERDPAAAPTQSALEDLVARILRRAGVPEPVRQYPVAGVLVDFAWPPAKVGLEADSRIWHGGRLDVQRNTDKANLLLAHGWRVVRATWADARRRAAQVVAAVFRELAPACPA